MDGDGWLFFSIPMVFSLFARGSQDMPHLFPLSSSLEMASSSPVPVTTESSLSGESLCCFCTECHTNLWSAGVQR